MITPLRPDDRAVRAFLERQHGRPFSYPEVGASGDGTTAPDVRGYTLDHDRFRVGTGEGDYRAAREALAAWKMFDVPRVTLCWPDAPLRIGTEVAVRAQVAGLWTVNACRITHLVDDGEGGAGEVERFGFAYGTIEGHAFDGEEVFAVERHREDDSVWWVRRAFSRPRHPLLRLGRPVLRRVQKRFSVHSVARMRRAVAEGAAQS